MLIKIINRVVFALVAALGLLLVFNLTDSYFKAKELVRLGEIAIQEGDIDSFLAVRFYRNEKIDTRRIVVGDSTYDFYLYNVAYISETETGYVVKEGMTFLLHLIEGDGMPDYTQVLFQSGEVDVVEQLGIRVFELPIYSGIDQVSMASVILVEKLTVDGVFQVIDSIEWLSDDVSIGSIDLEITAADFTIGAELETYVATNEAVPTEPFGSVLITKTLIIDTSLQGFIAGLTYLSVVALLTILLFKRNKNKMGKKPPTLGLKRDIEKIHQENQS
jgi:hypothetical protein